MSRNLVIVTTGTANVCSVEVAFRRLGENPVRTADADGIREADFVVLPGVGAYGAALAELSMVAEALQERIVQGSPTLGICLGMQLFGQGSEESPGVTGLGAFEGTFRRLNAYRPDGATEPDPRFRVPQMGWNSVGASEACRILTSDHFYFAHSYALYEPPPDWSSAMVDHGGVFVAGVERGPVVACQFHPELSGQAGEDLLKRWLQA